jgi:hypothetical protein
LYAGPEYQDTDITFDRNRYFSLHANSTNAERYLGSVYWIAATITAQGSVGAVLPQNEIEIMWTIFLMVLNMTLFRWVIGEVSSVVMNADEKVVQARQHLEQVTMFVSGKRFSPVFFCFCIHLSRFSTRIPTYSHPH